MKPVEQAKPAAVDKGKKLETIPNPTRVWKQVKQGRLIDIQEPKEQTEQPRQEAEINQESSEDPKAVLTRLDEQYKEEGRQVAQRCLEEFHNSTATTHQVDPEHDSAMDLVQVSEPGEIGIINDSLETLQEKDDTANMGAPLEVQTSSEIPVEEVAFHTEDTLVPCENQF